MEDLIVASLELTLLEEEKNFWLKLSNRKSLLSKKKKKKEWILRKMWWAKMRESVIL